MKIIIILPFLGCAMVMLIWDTIMLYKSKGIIKNSLSPFLFTLAILISYTIYCSPSTKIKIYLILVILLILIISIINVFINGYKIAIYYSITEQEIIEELVSILSENDIKSTVVKLKGKYRIILDNKIYSIELSKGKDNSKPKTLSFKGWIRYMKYREIRNKLIFKIENHVNGIISG